jgi:LysM repeat protein
MFTIILVSILLGAVLLGAFATSTVAEAPLYHTVKWGETLSRIARMYSVTVQELMKANGLANANVLYQGQKLVIPVPSEQYGEHILQPGETLLSVANKYDVSVWDIARLNGLWHINIVFVGQRLLIPSAEAVAPTPEPEQPATATVPTLPQVQEAIVITSPASDEVVSNPVVVTGWGSAFENTLVVDVLDGTGVSIGQGFVIIEAEVGQVGPFTGTIEFVSPSSAQLGRISVYSISPRDGAIEHLSSVTIKLEP